MNSLEFRNLILKQFPYSPTQGQEVLIRQLAEFIVSDHAQLPAFLLEGYAGTGKTTLVSALVNVLHKAGYEAVLLAPTGRAAKVFSGYAGRPAYTIHKKLYRMKAGADGSMSMVLMQNKLEHAVFIVDEASMIPDHNSSNESGFIQPRSLLDDLIEYIYTASSCKLILLGDQAQLPPVGIPVSPALNAELLKSSYFLDLDRHCLTEVVRQALESGILSNATGIRNKIGSEGPILPIFGTENKFPDVISVQGGDMLEALMQAYSDFGQENTVVITRSNKRANLFNQAIRQRILFRDHEISAGDHLMVVKNNYFWLPEDSKAGFIANGDLIEVMRIGRITELYSFRFAEVTMRMVDYPDEPTLDVMLLLDTLDTETPSLAYTESRKLYDEVAADYEEITSKRKKLAAIRANPYYNALQVKYAYSLTCHKTQGGQWDAVFIEKGYLTEEMLNTEYLRWLYTAVTRASKRLYLVNFEEKFFS
ncbi:MAG: AAA family ATPase [Bacteroidales bacterium]|nr:AAA family ATPase [Bacteroidales bacterium]